MRVALSTPMRCDLPAARTRPEVPFIPALYLDSGSRRARGPAEPEREIASTAPTPYQLKRRLKLPIRDDTRFTPLPAALSFVAPILVVPTNDNADLSAHATGQIPDARVGIAMVNRPSEPWRQIVGRPALAPEQERTAALLTDSRQLLWSARVTRVGDNYAWAVEIAPESVASPLIDFTVYKQLGHLWHRDTAPDYDAMEATFRTALERGDDRYQQHFRIQFEGRTVWLHEIVRIAPSGPNEWQCAGLVRDVSEQKLAEEAERRARGDVERLLQHTQCALWHATVTADPNKTLIWKMRLIPSGLQRAVFERMDNTAGEFYEGFIVPQLPEMDARATNAIWGGALGYQHEFAITRRRDQQTFWIREHVAIAKTGEEEWLLSGVMIDITAQKVAELARQDSDLHLARLLDQVDCIVWQGELLRAPNGDWRWRLSAPPSRLYRRLFNREPDSPTLKLLWTPEFTPEYQEMERRWRQAIADNVTEYEQEFRHLANGTEVWLHESVSILRRNATTIHLAGVIVDVTARKRAELALTAEKERFAVMIREMDESVVTVDLEDRITFLNDSAAKLLHVTSDALGKPWNEVAPLQLGQPPQPVPWPRSEKGSVALPADVQLALPRAPVRYVEGCVAPLHGPANQTAGAIIVFRDVTDRHLLQSQLQRAATLESVGVLAGGIAHDFNNILTALLANLSLAEMDAAPGTELALYLREAHAATDRAAALARQLLTFAKGGDPLLAAVDLGKAIEEVTRFTLRGTRVEPVFELARDLWPAQADAGQFSQIIQNLVLNASQSMPDGGTIRIAAGNEELRGGHRSGLPPGRYVRLIVSDTGVGIARDAMDKIFTPYFTTKSGGNGLGLAVVYSIVKKHHGAIDVRSVVTQGTSFDILLPAAHTAAGESSSSPRRGRGDVHGRILVMDDEAAILRVVSSYLRTLGMTVETTTDGEQAVAAYRNALATGKRFDAVVMDLTVPGKMGGREAITELRTLDPEVRAIVASGYSSDPVLANYTAFGFSAVAAKPFDIVQLGEQVAKLLDQPLPS